MCRIDMRRLVQMSNIEYRPARLRYSCCGSQGVRGLRCAAQGFTVIEILIVVVILGIAALTALPMLSSAASVQLRSAANMIAADLEYARSLSVSRGRNFTVVFDTAAESYEIQNEFGATIAHPVKKGFDYVIDLQGEGLERVDITNVDFAASSDVMFDYLGSPDDGGTVTVQGGNTTAIISVEPITGYITVTN